MAAETPPAEKPAKDDVDLVRAAIYFLGILLVGLCVVYWLLAGRRDQYLSAIEYGEKNLKAMATQYETVRGLVKQYKDSGADEARRETATWLKLRYQQAGIDQKQVKTDPWKDRPSKEFIENYVDVTVKDVRLDQAVHFLWNVEKVSPKMRTIESTLTRTAPNNAPETDLWELRASFGYRIPRLAK
jgi:hypothetical protein